MKRKVYAGHRPRALRKGPLTSKLARAPPEASLKDGNQTDAGIPSAGPGGIPFHNTTWLAREETHSRPPQSHPSCPRVRYLPDLKNALKSHMHVKHKLGYADRDTGYYTYYHNLLPHVDKSM
eukprot:1161944-Pelagomonas_calceolata.AAC.25